MPINVRVVQFDYFVMRASNVDQLRGNLSRSIDRAARLVIACHSFREDSPHHVFQPKSLEPRHQASSARLTNRDPPRA